MNIVVTNSARSGKEFYSLFIEKPGCLPINSSILQMSENPQKDNERHDLGELEEETKPRRITFPWQLHEMLADSEKESNGDIVGWQPDGLSFRVCKPKEFATTIMPRYFNHSNFRSFQRQVRKP